MNTTHDLRALTRDLLLVYSLPRRVPWVLLYHGSKPQWLDTPGRTRFTRATRLLVRRARAVLVLSSEEVRQWTALFPRTRFAMVSNPFSPAPGSGPHRGEPGSGVRVLFSGRLMPEKGLYDLLEAMALLVVAGGVHAADRRRGCDRGRPPSARRGPRAARPRVLPRLPGPEGMEAVYARADMLVLPSYNGEGFPTVLPEAMSHGLPVVTTPIRGAADHLVERENVLFVAPHSPREIAEAIVTLARDEPLRRTLGENNLSKVRDFAPERAVQDYLAVFEQVAGRATTA